MRVARGLRVGTVVAALMVIASNSSVLAGDACARCLLTGVLLWPAVALHFVLSILLGRSR